MRAFLTGVKRFILWDYPRATWQYDVMVGIILAFLFLTPRAWFRDQPRILKASKIAMLPANHGTDVFWLQSELLSGTADSDRNQKVRSLLKTQIRTEYRSIRLDPVYDSEHEIEGYMVYAKP